MGCLFCDIIAGKVAAAKVYEDGEVLVFLDHRPLFHGHCLVVPKEHHVTLPELPGRLVAPLFSVAQRVAEAVQQAMGAQGSFVAINNGVSQSVPHLHVHVVPRTKGDGLKGFFWPRHPYPSGEAMEQVGARIAAAMTRAG